MKPFLWIAGCLLFLLPGSAWGNDASYYGEGASVFAYKENRIRMVSEHIKIREDRDANHPAGEWFAECTFVFENLEDSPVTLQMGFPDQGAYPDGQWTIQAFTTNIKGENIPVTHKVVDPNHGRDDPAWGSKGEKTAPPLLPKNHDPDGWRAAAKQAMKEMNKTFGAAYTWPVSFKPRERITVKNTYRFGGGSSMGPVPACIQRGTLPEKGAFWHDKSQSSVFGNAPCSHVSYVVTTGRSWHGTIGEATIEIELPDRIAPNHVIPLPPATEVTDKIVKWHFKDFTPTQEIQLVFPMTFTDNDEEMAGTIDFGSVDQVKRWIQFGKDNGFTTAIFQEMADLQAYSFGLRTKEESSPVAFDDFLRPFSKTPQTRAKLTDVQREILDTLQSAATPIPAK